jgi:predicted ATPase
VARSAAVALFAQRVQAVDLTFQLTADNVATVAAICRRVDGLPLALELAAARTTALPLSVLMARLERRLTLLSGGPRDLPERQQTMRATIAWSYDLLPPAAQRLFRVLASFAGGCTLEALEEVGAGLGEAPDGLLDDLALLATSSLLQREETRAGQPRYAMLETIREYGRELLLASGDAARVSRHHAACYLALAERAEPFVETAAGLAWLDQLEQDHDNLRAALSWAAESGEVAWGLRAAAALRVFWFMRGHLAEGRQRLRELLALSASAAGAATRARGLDAAGFLARYQGDYAAAAQAISEALALRRAIDDQGGVADSLANLGYVALYQGDDARARALYEESLAISRRLGNAQGIADALSHLGLLALYQGDHATARAHHEQSLRLWEDLGDQLGIAWALSQLGNVALHEQDSADAAACFQRSVALHRRLGDAWGIAEALEGLASVAAARTQPERALTLAGAAAALREAIGTALPLAGQDDLRRNLAPAHAMLDGTSRARAWESGRSMTLEQAITAALRESERA